METFKNVIWIVNIFASLGIIVLVLMQHGKGADTGASFGGSGSAQGKGGMDFSDVKQSAPQTQPAQHSAPAPAQIPAPAANGASAAK